MTGPEVLDKVFLSIDDASLPDMVRLADGTDELRLYAGHAAWVPGQLQAEIGAGGWQILRGTPEIVFHADPGKPLDGARGQRQRRRQRRRRRRCRLAFVPRLLARLNRSAKH